MSVLSLYSIFHGNLNYSSIPEDIFHEIIDSCYWPILELIRDHDFKTGIEFPINTLEKIHDIDPLFIQELKKQIQNKKCEFIFSGQEQILSPLIPEEINLQNIETGLKNLDKLLSIKPKIAFVNEQIFSNGLIPIYNNSKLKNLILIQESASISSKSAKISNFSPLKITYENFKITALWNSRIAYQKFQNYIVGKISKQQYINFILKNKNRKNSCFPFYGSDMEIFGYDNPVLGLKGKGNEITRLYDIIHDIKNRNDLEFLLPSEIIQKFKSKKEIQICSAEYPILGKKEESIVTRWAVCGRDNSKTNSLCYDAYKKTKLLDLFQTNTLKKKNTFYSKLVDCWGSDYRTHTDEKKFHLFNKKINSLNDELNLTLSKHQTTNSPKPHNDITIHNPNNHDWNNFPLEIELFLKPGMFNNLFEIHMNNNKIKSQIENIHRYRDGSLRSALVVLAPKIPKKSSIKLQIKNSTKTLTNIKKFSPKNELSNKNCDVSFSNTGAITYLKFKNHKTPLITTKSSEVKIKSFQKLLSTQLYVKDFLGKTYTDNKKIKFNLENDCNPIRKKISYDVDLAFGKMSKSYMIYENIPQIDIKYIFTFKNFKPSIFRINLLNLSSKNFNSSLSYSTHNGGTLESFQIKDPINHNVSTNPKISTSNCLGTTNCFLDIGDKNYGISIFSDKSKWYSVPLINSKNSKISIIPTTCEMDDTTMTWWKGRKEISFSIFGRKNNLSQMVKNSESIFLGLIIKSNNPNILVKN